MSLCGFPHLSCRPGHTGVDERSLTHTSSICKTNTFSISLNTPSVCSSQIHIQYIIHTYTNTQTRIFNYYKVNTLIYFQYYKVNAFSNKNKSGFYVLPINECLIGITGVFQVLRTRLYGTGAQVCRCHSLLDVPFTLLPTAWGTLKPLSPCGSCRVCPPSGKPLSYAEEARGGVGCTDIHVLLLSDLFTGF